MLLLDNTKAFDRVDHGILLRKLASMGIPDLLTRYLTSFLCGGRQCTKLGDIVLEWTTTNACVPQGTLFGPVEFVIHINDLRTDVNISKCVDDSSLWEVRDRLAGDSQLQRAADQALQWSENNHMLVNSDKTKELLVHYFRKPSSVPNVTIQGNDIERVYTTKLLGVTSTSDLTLGRACERGTQQGSPAVVFADSAEGRRDAASEHAQGVHSSGEAAHRVCLPGMAHDTDGTPVRQAGEHSAMGLEEHLSRTIIQRGVGGVLTTHAVRSP